MTPCEHFPTAALAGSSLLRFHLAFGFLAVGDFGLLSTFRMVRRTNHFFQINYWVFFTNIGFCSTLQQLIIFIYWVCFHVSKKKKHLNIKTVHLLEM